METDGNGCSHDDRRVMGKKTSLVRSIGRTNPVLEAAIR